MAKIYRFQFKSFLPNVTKSQVWQRVGSWHGVNAELGSVFQMTFPDHFPRVDDIPADGNCHFTSTVLLLGVLPIDRHRFSLVDLKPDNYFDERSTNFNMSFWTHKRTLTEVAGGVEVADFCSFEPRLGLLGGILSVVYKWVFARRHKRLVSYFAKPAFKVQSSEATTPSSGTTT